MQHNQLSSGVQTPVGQTYFYITSHNYFKVNLLIKKLWAFTIGCLIFQLLIGIGFAQNMTNKTAQYCSDSQTLMKVTIFTWDGTSHNLTEPKNCPNGCLNDECQSPPYIIYGIIFALVLVASVIYAIFIRQGQ